MLSFEWDKNKAKKNLKTRLIGDGFSLSWTK